MSRDQRMQLDAPPVCPPLSHVAPWVASGTGGFAVNTHKKKAGFGWRYRHAKDAAKLLEALEALQAELGSVGEDIITIMRDAGVKPPDEPGSEDGRPSQA